MPYESKQKGFRLLPLNLLQSNRPCTRYLRWNYFHPSTTIITRASVMCHRYYHTATFTIFTIGTITFPCLNNYYRGGNMPCFLC